VAERRALALALAAAAALAAAPAADAAPKVVAKAARERCVAPCAVFFDATGTTDPSTEHPFHVLDYAWDFGDARGQRWAVSGRDKNRAIGALAGHLYEKPGRFTATLVVTNPAGEKGRATLAIEVADPEQVFAGDKTLCVSASGTFDGCPAGARHKTSKDFDGSISNADARRTLFRRGERFEWDAQVRLGDASRSGSLLGAFGPGAGRAEVHAKGKVKIDPGNDWRVEGLALHGPPGSDGAAIGETDGVRRFTVHDVEVRGFNNCASFWSPNAPDVEVAFVDVRCADFPDPGDGAKFFEDTEDSMFLGLEVDRGEMKSPQDSTEFGHRSIFSRRKIVQHSRYTGRAPNQSKNALQLRHCPSSPDWLGRCPNGKVPGQYVIVSDNHFVEGGGPRGLNVVRTCDHASCDARGGHSQPLLDWIFERNLVQVRGQDASRDQMQAVFQLQSGRTTVRNNVADLQGWPAKAGAGRSVLVWLMPPSNAARDSVDGVWVLNNTVYLGSGYAGAAIVCAGPAGQGHLCDNNLLYAPAHGGRLMPAMGPGWRAEGNQLLDGAASPFAAAPPGPLRASLRELDAFRLGPGGPAGIDLGATPARWMARDAALRCRGAGPPDAGAFERDGSDC
jgi:hypothetical protein